MVLNGINAVHYCITLILIIKVRNILLRVPKVTSVHVLLFWYNAAIVLYIFIIVLLNKMVKIRYFLCYISMVCVLVN